MMIRYDTIHGKYDGTVEVDGDSLVIDGQKAAWVCGLQGTYKGYIGNIRIMKKTIEATIMGSYRV